MVFLCIDGKRLWTIQSILSRAFLSVNAEFFQLSAIMIFCPFADQEQGSDNRRSPAYFVLVSRKRLGVGTGEVKKRAIPPTARLSAVAAATSIHSHLNTFPHGFRNESTAASSEHKAYGT